MWCDITYFSSIHLWNLRYRDSEWQPGRQGHGESNQEVEKCDRKGWLVEVKNGGMWNKWKSADQETDKLMFYSSKTQNARKDQQFHPHKPCITSIIGPVLFILYTWLFASFNFSLFLDFLVSVRLTAWLMMDELITQCFHLSVATLWAVFLRRDTKRVLREQLRAGIAHCLFSWAFCLSEKHKKNMTGPAILRRLFKGWRAVCG